MLMILLWLAGVVFVFCLTVYITVKVGYRLKDRWYSLQGECRRRRRFARWFNKNAPRFWELKSLAFRMAFASGLWLIVMLLMVNNERLDSQVVTLYTTSSGGEVVEMQSPRRDVWDGRTSVEDDDHIWLGEVYACNPLAGKTTVAKVKYRNEEVDVVSTTCKVGDKIHFRVGRLRAFSQKGWFYFELTESEAKALTARGIKIRE